MFAELGRTDRARRQIDDHRRRFDAAFARAAGNITEPGEREIIEAIRRERDEYYKLFDGSADYFERMEPRFDSVRADVDRLLQLNQSAMLRKSAEAQRVTGRSIMMTVFLSAVLVLAGLGFAVQLSAQIDKDADRLKSEFVATASHELRTPLTTLQMGIDLLEEQVNPRATDREREILAMCRRGCRTVGTSGRRPARPVEDRVGTNEARSLAPRRRRIGEYRPRAEPASSRRRPASNCR